MPMLSASAMTVSKPPITDDVSHLLSTEEWIPTVLHASDVESGDLPSHLLGAKVFSAVAPKVISLAAVIDSFHLFVGGDCAWQIESEKDLAFSSALSAQCEGAHVYQPRAKTICADER